MHDCPDVIGDMPVIASAVINAAVKATDNTRHTLNGEEMPMPVRLAICDAGDGFYLFYCDAAWRQLTGTWHATPENAKHQAEFEFTGISGNWQS